MAVNGVAGPPTPTSRATDAGDDTRSGREAQRKTVRPEPFGHPGRTDRCASRFGFESRVAALHPHVPDPLPGRARESLDEVGPLAVAVLAWCPAARRRVR